MMRVWWLMKLDEWISQEEKTFFHLVFFSFFFVDFYYVFLLLFRLHKKVTQANSFINLSFLQIIASDSK